MTGPKAHDAEDDQDSALTALLKIDYDNTTRFIDSVLGTIGTQRGWLITIWLAVMGVAIKDHNSALSLLGLATVLVFAFLDAFHSSLYHAAFRHAQKIEDIWASWYEGLGVGAHDPDVRQGARAKLQAHRFGLFDKLRPVSSPDADKRPSGAFTWAYVFLAGSSAFAAIAYAV